MKTTFDEICEVKLPEETRSYKPVPHGDLVLMIRDHLKERKIDIISERFELGAEGNQLFGSTAVKSKSLDLSGGETTGVLGYRNSYDKSLSVGLVTGAHVIVCSNLMFEGEIKLLRKHTTFIYNDLTDLINSALDTLDANYSKILKQIEQLKLVEVDKLLAAEICGEMFMAEEIITSTQLNVIKHHWDAMKKDVQTGWDFMNHCTEGMKKAHPTERINRQLMLAQFLEKRLIK